MMCSDCCKHLTGWCKSFTKTEVFLCVLQVIFLVVFIAFLTFLILHLEVCSRNKQRFEGTRLIELHRDSNQTTKTINTNEFESSTDSLNANKGNVTNLDETKYPYKKLQITVNTDKTLVNAFDTAVKCTWKPSKKTEAFTHYYEYNQTVRVTKADEEEMPTLLQDNILLEDPTDGKEIYDSRKDFLLALVKIKPPQAVTFGCTLTIVSEFWTLTAASCIEAIEEVDSLDSFFMMQGLKEEKQNIYPVEDIMIHPQYEGVNFTYDLAALKSESRLVKKGSSLVTLPSMVDYFLITIGERLTILGYGRFRSIDKDPLSRSVRAARVHSVPLAQCARESGAWAVRHVRAGAAPLCAGVLRARAAPCTYCAGTPLLRRAVLLGVMSANRHCGVACEPALYVNLALVADWLRAVLESNHY